MIAPVPERLDVLALVLLPFRSGGRTALQVGGSLYGVWLLEALARAGHRVRAIAPGPEPRGDAEPLALDGVDVDWFAVGFLPSDTPPLADDIEARRRQFCVALDRAIESGGRPDVVVLGNESHPWYAAEACRERGLPTALVAHGIPTAGLLADIYPPDAVRGLVERMDRVDLVVTVGPHLEEILRTLGLTRVTTIATGVDTDLLHPRPKDPELLAAYGIEADRFVVGSFSHMRPEKRVADLVRSAAEVVRAEPGVVYLLVGGGPLVDEVTELAGSLGVDGAVRVVGEVEYRDVPAHMALCDAVVIASDREGTPLVGLEAMAAGVPLLHSDIPAGRALTADGAGAVFGVGETGELAARTLELVRDGALRERMGARGRERALAQSREAWLASWVQALAGLAAR